MAIYLHHSVETFLFFVREKIVNESPIAVNILEDIHQNKFKMSKSAGRIKLTMMVAEVDPTPTIAPNTTPTVRSFRWTVSHLQLRFQSRNFTSILNFEAFFRDLRARDIKKASLVGKSKREQSVSRQKFEQTATISTLECTKQSTLETWAIRLGLLLCLLFKTDSRKKTPFSAPPSGQ